MSVLALWRSYHLYKQQFRAWCRDGKPTAVLQSLHCVL